VVAAGLGRWSVLLGCFSVGPQGIGLHGAPPACSASPSGSISRFWILFLDLPQQARREALEPPLALNQPFGLVSVIEGGEMPFDKQLSERANSQSLAKARIVFDGSLGILKSLPLNGFP